ncbi:MAG: septum formation initiator family protein [Thermoleophilia bacterium]|nr:septum formation initiator family protein [Thermoleophilia bacterium]
MARRRPSRSTLALRWLAVVVLALIAAAYVQPLRAYLSARDEVGHRRAEIDALRRERRRLALRLEYARTDEFVVRAARKLGLVRPGERLYIVTGLPHRSSVP